MRTNELPHPSTTTKPKNKKNKNKKNQWANKQKKGINSPHMSKMSGMHPSMYAMSPNMFLSAPITRQTSSTD
jgi:hypothetical protein